VNARRRQRQLLLLHAAVVAATTAVTAAASVPVWRSAPCGQRGGTQKPMVRVMRQGGSNEHAWPARYPRRRFFTLRRGVGCAPHQQAQHEPGSSKQKRSNGSRRFGFRICTFVYFGLREGSLRAWRAVVGPSQHACTTSRVLRVHVYVLEYCNTFGSIDNMLLFAVEGIMTSPLLPTHRTTQEVKFLLGVHV
jgi:hypothetical protein